jgi:hypothetical protein
MLIAKLNKSVNKLRERGRGPKSKLRHDLVRSRDLVVREEDSGLSGRGF